MGAGFVTVYWLDGSDHLVRVSDSWDVFALSNDGESCRWESIRGRPLWEFVSGDPTRMWLRTLMGHVRISAGEVERPYRCDSPTERRHMAMRIVAEPGSQLRIENVVLRSEPREHVVRVEPTPPSLGRSSRRCSVCGRIGRGARWFEPESQEARELLDASGTLRVIYGVCEPCLRMLPPVAGAAG